MNLREGVGQDSIKRSRRSHRGEGVQLVESLLTLLYKFSPFSQAMKNPDAKAAVDKEWEKLEKFWTGTKVKSKREVILEAEKEQRTVHFATLMDICHFKKMQSWSRTITSVKAGVWSEHLS